MTQVQVPPPTVGCMDDLDLWFAAHGVVVVEVDMSGPRWGWYSMRDGIVAVRRGLLDCQRRAVLLHEAQHVLRGDDGHQSQCVEDRIDETVAGQLIDLVEYARAEDEYGWNSGAIAAELGVPKWVVQAYRRALTRAIESVQGDTGLTNSDGL